MKVNDRRSTLCRKWRVIAGTRTPCSFDRDHEGYCSWDTRLKPDPNRDPGPFYSPDQAIQQYARFALNQPIPMNEGSVLQVLEALLLAGVEPSAFEQEYLTAHKLDLILSTILQGWLMRAAHPYLRRGVSPDEGAGTTP